jgi:hypothetical protein
MKTEFPDWDLKGKPLYQQLEIVLGECFVHDMNHNRERQGRPPLSLVLLGKERQWSTDFLELRVLYDILLYRGYVAEADISNPEELIRIYDVKIDPRNNLLNITITDKGVSFYMLGGFNEEKRKIDNDKNVIEATLKSVRYTKYLFWATVAFSIISAFISLLDYLKDSPK